MTTHVLEVGPNKIRQLCCGERIVDDDEMVTAAIDSIDDPVALIDLRPVTVDSLWRTVLGSYAFGSSDRAIVVHPSWWAPARIDLLSAAAEDLAGDVVLQPRSWLLIQASPLESQNATVVVEIADWFVVVTGTAVVAETRRAEPERVAEAVIRSVREMTSGAAVAVVIDASSTVGEARALAAMIADGLRVSDGISVVRVDDAGLKKLAAQIVQDESSAYESDRTKAANRGYRRHWGPILLAVLLSVAVFGVLGVLTTGHQAVPAGDGMPTTFLVEGHVALRVPVQWPMQRIIAGPGSARVRVTSPSDPEVALHMTQSQVPIATLSATADSLKHAIEAEPTGVFTDFNPAGNRTGRPAVTYRELRPGHDIQWIVLVDKAVRISIGCQSHHGDDDAVRQVCDLAVGSARALS